jgi:integral membrane protein
MWGPDRPFAASPRSRVARVGSQMQSGGMLATGSNAPPASAAPSSPSASTAVSRLRAVGIAEGISFLILLGVAMPLKYWAGLPLAVKVVGWVHGVLFIAYCVCLIQAARKMRWDVERCFALLIAALLPFGPFVMARGLEREAGKAS